MHSFIKKIVLFSLKYLLETEEAHNPKLLPSYKLQLIFSNIVIMGDIIFQFMLTTVTVVLQLEIYSKGGGGNLPSPAPIIFSFYIKIWASRAEALRSDCDQAHQLVCVWEKVLECSSQFETASSMRAMGQERGISSHHSFHWPW